ncbi:nicotinate-nucleotide adenylyltransferase [Mycoplasmopsis pullorum]|uniref:Probable nicotinate-nucleotide adenylyltransferase n=1 Tax=Mycoplasmopsis pullorum TaxID=48003 RepID=A0A1L4FSG0_9BACT|nr:nicotinate-nucleotide adenylyltransferase [Mycoplasmopsis pullorum]APJ38522.1 nicotinate (nicotinamide) nucleotide adenylyltransferase [Mycoplasmopsis pullorum]
MKIGIFGGSFDPIHKGHIRVAQQAIKELNLDKLFFVPANKSPFKLKNKYASNEDRVEMIKLVLPDKCEISNFEINRGGTSFSIDTARYFKNKFPNDEIFMLIGTDNLPKLPKWKDIEELSQIVKLTFIRRNKNVNKVNIKRFNGILLNNKLEDFSSTEFKKGYLDSVDEKVMEYIGTKQLYAFEIIHQILSAKRAKHCVKAAEFAASLAKAHNISAKDAYYAGLFHDLAKEWSEEESRNFIETCGWNQSEFKKHELHQTCGYLWLKNVYKYPDASVLHAILIHTTLNFKGDASLSELDKILYISDKICDGRKFPGIQKIRELAHENLDLGFKAVVKRVYDFETKEKGTIFSKEQEKVYLDILE